MKHPETEFHITVADYLRRALPRDMPWTTIGHGVFLGDGMVTVKGGKQIPRRVIRAKLLEQMGVMPGWPDILILRPLRPIGLELKSRFGVVSADQKTVHALIKGAGGIVYVCRLLEEVEGYLRGEGIMLRCRVAA